MVPQDGQRKKTPLMADRPQGNWLWVDLTENVRRDVQPVDLWKGSFDHPSDGGDAMVRAYMLAG